MESPKKKQKIDEYDITENFIDTISNMDYPHHYCRSINNIDCTDLNECRCKCDNCEKNYDKNVHDCLELDNWLCFKNWKFEN